MAKASTVAEPAGMEKGDIKRFLRMAREEPVSVAFALGGDGKAILQLDRRKPGRALEKQLKDADPDSKSHRWGTALVDPDDDKTVRFTVNKAGGGLARKLIVALKGTGFNKVKIQLEDGTEVEAHQEADEDGDGGDNAKPSLGALAGEAAGAAAGAAESDTGMAGIAAMAGEAAGAATAGAAASTDSQSSPAAAPAAALPDASALAKDLTGLVKRMLAVIAKDPTQKAALAELATDAQASLKRGDLQQASAGIDILREAISDGEAAVAGGARAAGAANGAAPATNGAATPHAGNAAEHQGTAAKGSPAAQTNGAAQKQNGAAPAAPGLGAEGEEILATLTGAVKKVLPMLSLVPGLGDLVKTIVPAVQSAVKAGQIEQARSGLQHLLDEIAKGQAVGAAAGGVGQAAGGAAHDAQKAHQEHAAKHAPAIDKAGTVWSATRQKVMTEIEKLEKAFTSALDGHGMMEDLTKTLRTKVEGTLHHLDDRLMHTLAAVNKAPDAAERAKHVEQAHKLVQHYQAHVSSDKTIKMLDTNPFHPLAIEKMVMSSLAALQKTIH